MPEYRINAPLTVAQFRALLVSSGLGERRPIEDETCLQGMLVNSNLVVTAWHGEQVIGIARSITDFHYACYLSDLAVDRHWQVQGVGLELQKLTQQQLGPRCKLILLAAPDAVDYYPAIGYEPNPRGFVLERDRIPGK